MNFTVLHHKLLNYIPLNQAFYAAEVFSEHFCSVSSFLFVYISSLSISTNLSLPSKKNSSKQTTFKNYTFRHELEEKFSAFKTLMPLTFTIIKLNILG